MRKRTHPDAATPLPVRVWRASHRRQHISSTPAASTSSVLFARISAPPSPLRFRRRPFAIAYCDPPSCSRCAALSRRACAIFGRARPIDLSRRLLASSTGGARRPSMQALSKLYEHLALLGRSPGAHRAFSPPFSPPFLPAATRRSLTAKWTLTLGLPLRVYDSPCTHDACYELRAPVSSIRGTAFCDSRTDLLSFCLSA